MKKVISKDGTSIAYQQLGKGAPVILVDGALCSSVMGPMPKLAPLLAKDFSVIIYDRRGRHESSDTAPYAVTREVEDIAALIEEVGGSAMVFGMSSGAILAIAAVAQGLNITTLAVYEPPFIPGKHRQDTPENLTEKLTALIAAGRRSDAVSLFLKNIGVPVIVIFIMKLTPVWSKLKAIAHTLPYDAAITGDGTFPEKQLAAIKIPTLIAGGEKSKPFLPVLKKLANTLSNNECTILKGESHNVSAKVLAPVLCTFFKRHL